VPNQKAELPKIPATLTIRFGVPLTSQIFAFTEHTDVIYSRLVKRAVEKELARCAKLDPKLKNILERAKNGTATRNRRK
jgi:hypothetical protein